MRGVRAYRWPGCRLLARLVLGASLFVTFQASADTLEGKVVHVNDGDTLTVLVERRQVRIRLVEIDAPESKQAFGKRSKQSLAQLCAGKLAKVEWTQRDRYGRTLGWVVCDRSNANAEQVRRGMAWVFVKFAPKNSPLYPLEAKARQSRIGLWSDRQPIAPWEWRALGRSH